MIIRYQADADLNQAIVTGVLRQKPNLNFQTSYQAQLASLTDLEVLALAADQKLILVTHDRKTMPFHFAEFILTNQSYGVLIVSKKVKIEIVINELILIWSASSAEEWINRLAKIPL